MPVDYTKVFTIIGKHVKKLNDYFALISTVDTDEGDIETVLTAQGVARLIDGLGDVFSGIKSSIASWSSDLIGRTTIVLTDQELIGDQFSFGASPTLPTVFPKLIRDMSLNDKNVTASAMTTGSITRTVTNANAGYLVLGTKLDGVTPPISGAQAIAEYAGLVSQFYPDDELVTLVCENDVDNGAQRGNERFSIKGTGPVSGPYSVNGESLGSGGQLTVADLGAGSFGQNLNFDSWSGTPESPTTWVVDDGVAGTDFEKEDTDTLFGSGNAFKTIGTPSATTVALRQVLNSAIFIRQRSYFIAVWARKKTDTGQDPIYNLVLRHSPGGTPTNLLSVAIQPTGVAWELFSGQVVIPAQIEGDLELILTGSVDNATDNDIVIDQIVIVPCQYVAGVAMAVFGGPQTFRKQDTFEFNLSNDNAGKFQEYFRKAYRIQLPTDATPTIDDALVV